MVQTLPHEKEKVGKWILKTTMFPISKSSVGVYKENLPLEEKILNKSGIKQTWILASSLHCCTAFSLIISALFKI